MLRYRMEVEKIPIQDEGVMMSQHLHTQTPLFTKGIYKKNSLKKKEGLPKLAETFFRFNNSCESKARGKQLKSPFSSLAVGARGIFRVFMCAKKA